MLTRPDVTSSSRQTLLPPTYMQASCSLRFCPPLNVPACALFFELKSQASTRCARAVLSPLENLISFHILICSSTVSSFHKMFCCGHIPYIVSYSKLRLELITLPIWEAAALIRIEPPVNFERPPIMSKVVVLPLPLAPSRQTT
jgi:hypothetical protein